MSGLIPYETWSAFFFWKKTKQLSWRKCTVCQGRKKSKQVLLRCKSHMYVTFLVFKCPQALAGSCDLSSFSFLWISIFNCCFFIPPKNMSLQSVRSFREQAERFVVVVTKQNSCYKYVAKLFFAVFTKMLHFASGQKVFVSYTNSTLSTLQKQR